MQHNYRATLEVKLYIRADNQETVEQILGEMDYSFVEARTLKDIESEIEDWEIKEVMDNE